MGFNGRAPCSLPKGIWCYSTIIPAGDDRRGRGDRERRRSGGSWGDDTDDQGRGNDGGEDEPPKKPEPVNYVPEDRTEEQLFAETGK